VAEASVLTPLLQQQQQQWPPSEPDLHPVLDLISARQSDGSSPGNRQDGAKLGLVVEGGGMRGIVTGESPETPGKQTSALAMLLQALLLSVSATCRDWACIAGLAAASCQHTPSAPAPHITCASAVIPHTDTAGWGINTPAAPSPLSHTYSVPYCHSHFAILPRVLRALPQAPC
jgi:hypothetical protein